MFFLGSIALFLAWGPLSFCHLYLTQSYLYPQHLHYATSSARQADTLRGEDPLGLPWDFLGTRVQEVVLRGEVVCNSGFLLLYRWDLTGFPFMRSGTPSDSDTWFPLKLFRFERWQVQVNSAMCWKCASDACVNPQPSSHHPTFFVSSKLKSCSPHSSTLSLIYPAIYWILNEWKNTLIWWMYDVFRKTPEISCSTGC